MLNSIANRHINSSASLLSAMKQMDVIDKKLLLVFEGNQFVNIISIGDIQRAILKGIALDSPISSILRKNTRIASDQDSFESIKNLMKEYRIECMPVVNGLNDLVNVYFWDEVFGIETQRAVANIELPVIIMAGGKGTRLKPLTNVIPKPLIPVGDKTILENIFDRFSAHGSHRFFVSINYKADLIKYYVENLNLPYQIDYFIEEKPLGTAGSMSLLKGKINETFFVSNCDILIEQDYSEILKYHRENKNELTIVSAFKHYSIPYGTIETEEGGILKTLKEKPELTFQINSGMYILEPHLLDEIPENEFFHITDLIDLIVKRKGKVGVFPVSEGSWKDIGEWDQYLKYFK